MSVLELDDVRKDIGTTTVLESVSMSVSRGEIYGVVGPNGDGETTAFRWLLGLVPVESGTVRVEGTEPRNDDSVLEDVGVVFEYETHHPNWSVRDTMEHASCVYDVPSERVETCLEQVGLEGSAHDRQFRKLSKGMKRKTSVATALLHEPEILVLDEPLSGLDPETQVLMGDLFRDLKEAGRTIVFSSHTLEDVQELCDRVCLVSNGKTLLETSLGGEVYVLDEPKPEVDATPAGDRYVVQSDGTEPPVAGVQSVDLEERSFSTTGVGQ